jgi:hypothetical protein
MVTRRSVGVVLKPTNRLNLSAMISSAISLVPSDYQSALANPHWRAAMQDEFQALLDNGTWTLVPHPIGANVSLGNEYSSTSLTPMALSLGIKPIGSFEDTLNSPVWIMMRHLVQSSSQPPSS